MSGEERTYSNGEVTIVWKRHLCTHSTRCWKGLPEVFKPLQRPWVIPEGSTTDKIVTQVGRCPSGALTTLMHGAAADTTQEQ